MVGGGEMVGEGDGYGKWEGRRVADLCLSTTSSFASCRLWLRLVPVRVDQYGKHAVGERRR